MAAIFRIAICNLQTGIGTTRGYWHYLTTAWKYMLPHRSRGLKYAATFLREESVDVAALCEVEGGSRRTRGVDQLARLAELSSLPNQAFFPTFVVGSRINQGNAVCSHFPVTLVRNHALPGAGEPRFLSEAEITVDTTAIRLFVTHLSLDREIRSPQIVHVAELLRKRKQPTILAGDFNVSARAELDLLAEGDLTHAASAPTFPSWRPKKHLDHLFLSGHFHLIESGPFDRFLFSDHLPFCATVGLRDSS